MRSKKAEARLQKIRALTTPYDVTYGGITLTVDQHVYPTSELSELVVECLDDPVYGITPGDTVLDYGTGTGFLAIQAARRKARVVAVDINPDAIDCAKKNAARHRVSDRISFRVSHNLKALKQHETFNIITAGMPWDDAQPADMLEYSVYDPQFQMKRALFQQGSDLLKPKGKIILTYGEAIQARHPMEEFSQLYQFFKRHHRTINNQRHFVCVAMPGA